MRHSTTKNVFRHWQSLRGTRMAPDRRQLNPADLGGSLADVFLLERRDSEIRIRLAGSRICNLFGGELRDLPFIALFSHEANGDAHDMLMAVSEETTPVIAGISCLYHDHISTEGELLLLPLTHESGQTGDMRVLGVLTTTGHRPLSQPPCSAIEVLTIRMLGDNDQTNVFAGHQAPLNMPILPDQAAMRRSRFRVYEGGAT